MRLKGKKPKDKAYPREIKTIGDVIRKRRLDLELKQKDVAKIIGCDEMSVLNWEKAHTSPATNKISGIWRFLESDRKTRQKTVAGQFDLEWPCAVICRDLNETAPAGRIAAPL